MTPRCIDAEAADALAAGTGGSEVAWERHLADCEFCGAIRGLAARAPLPEDDHPSGDALTSYVGAKERMSPAARKSVRDHVMSCAECRNLVRDVPVPRAFPNVREPKQLSAAAVFVIVLLVIFQWTMRDWSRKSRVRSRRPPTSVVNPLQTTSNAPLFVLTAMRGEPPQRFPRLSGSIRLKFLLDENVGQGDILTLRWLSDDGAEKATQPVFVFERDGSGWPIVEVDASAIPNGVTRLEVKAPTGALTTFSVTFD
jgi:hypothetical protein